MKVGLPGDVHKTCRRIRRRHGWIEGNSEYGTVAEEVGERGRSLSITSLLGSSIWPDKHFAEVLQDTQDMGFILCTPFSL
jgi:hypothetical protein